jgi:hypothetical protein
LEIEDSWAAYQLDLACLTVGRWVENRLARRDKKGRPVFTLEMLLHQDDGEGQPGGGAFRSLAGMVRRKARIDRSGVW